MSLVRCLLCPSAAELQCFWHCRAEETLSLADQASSLVSENMLLLGLEQAFLQGALCIGA